MNAFKLLIATAISSASLLATSALAANTNLLSTNQNATTTQNATPPTLVPPAPALNAKGYVLMDANSGNIIAQKNMDQRMEPASLTKMMTLYVTFQALASGQIHLDDSVRVSKQAWSTGGSRMFLKVGSDVKVSQLIQGVIVDSGNDACVTLAQYIGGTEDTFANLMNQTAVRLNMDNTHYVDSTGLPRPQHYSTPHDMALLARAIIEDFPQYYHFFNEKWLKYNNIKQPNRNRLLWRDPSVDGLKTGHTAEAGYCLVTSAKRDDTRLISVVMGTPTDNARADDSQALLNYGFRFFKTYTLFDAQQALAKPRAWYGEKDNVSLGLAKPLQVTVPVGEYNKLQAQLKLPKRIEAPIKQGDAYGNVVVTLNGQVISTTPLVALESDARGGLFTRAADHISMTFHKWF